MSDLGTTYDLDSIIIHHSCLDLCAVSKLTFRVSQQCNNQAQILHYVSSQSGGICDQVEQCREALAGRYTVDESNHEKNRVTSGDITCNLIIQEVDPNPSGI